MWSDRYYYLNIVRDLRLSEEVSTQELVRFLATLPELKQDSDYFFSNSDQFTTHIKLLLLKANNYKSWSDKDVSPNATNMLAIVCAKQDLQSFENVKALLIKIASFLNWQLIDEQTDNGMENFSLWTPDSAAE